MRRWPSHIYAASSDWWPRAATRARRRRSRASSCRGSDLVNVTLIFSLRRYAEVAESYIRGLERLVAEGGDPSKAASVAGFFVSRIRSGQRDADLLAATVCGGGRVIYTRPRATGGRGRRPEQGGVGRELLRVADPIWST